MAVSKPEPDEPRKVDRDQRLAAALRENLKRRKAQARSLQEKTKPSPEQITEEKTGG